MPSSPDRRFPDRGVVAAVLFAAAALAVSASPSPFPSLHLMPVPSRLALTGGKFRITEAAAIGALGEAGERSRKAAARFMGRLAGRTGLFFEKDFLAGTAKPDEAGFLFKAGASGPLDGTADESYALTISPDRVLLVAPTDIGVLRGLETVLQLVEADDRGYFVPCIQIEDRPRFRWRGLLIDAGRHFMPVDVIKRNLDAMAAVKMNVLHWHLTEDQGFRLESLVFPRLHTEGSDGFYYTRDQVRDVVAYASDRGIRVMPEFDIPGHSTSWFAAYPELAAGPGPFRVERRWGVFDPVFNAADERVYAFFDRFFQEMAALFPDPYIHIGGDENNGRQWDANPEVVLFRQRQGLADDRALQAYFNGRILKILAKYRKKMVGWDEIFQPGLPRDIVIQSWRGRDSLFESAGRGYAGILSNGYYLDHCLPAEKYYQNDPLPAEVALSQAARSLVLGGEAAMWSEFVSAETVDSRIWPQTAAIAERLWSPADVRDIEDMYRRLGTVSIRLEELGLLHIKNQDMILRRLAGASGIDPLKTLVEVVEPLKGYARQSQIPRYTQLSPLTRFVDAAFPESLPARTFRQTADKFAETRDRALGEALRGPLQRWRVNGDLIRPVIQASPALGEIEALSRDLGASAEIGIQALDAILAGTAPDTAWAAESLKFLEQAKKPKAHAELAVVSGIEKLVRMTLAK